MIEPGDAVAHRLIAGGAVTGLSAEIYSGRVLWIHPSRGWYVAEFPMPGGGTVRECFWCGARALPDAEGRDEPPDRDRAILQGQIRKGRHGRGRK